jgi:hypothetical protein
MRPCPECGKDIKDRAEICKWCLSPVLAVGQEPAAQTTEPTTIRCPFCSEPILSSARKCKHCQEWLHQGTGGASGKTPHPAHAGTRRSTAGWWLLAIGVVIVVVALGMDTSVATESGSRVHNIGLMQTQQNTLIFGAVVMLGGIIALVTRRK